ncbi:MAG: uroporphyrinogen decarboxylase family protein [Candidatus Methanomethylicaceae archaeon]
MNPRERFITALEGETPDRIPLFFWGINGILLQKIFNKPIFQRNPIPYLEMCAKGKMEEAHLKIAEETIELGEKFDLDAVREVNQIGTWLIDPRWEFFPKNSHVIKRGNNIWEIDNTLVQYLPATNILLSFKPFLPKDPDKAREILEERFDDVNIIDQETLVIEKISKKLKGKRFIIGVVQGTFLPFASPSTHMFTWIYKYPNLFRRWMEYYLKVNIERAKAKIDAGADAIVENDDYADNHGPMIPPKLFKEYILPNLKKLCDVVHSRGAYFIKHTDGNINPILDDIISSGIDGLHPLEKNAKMDIAFIKAKYGDKICVLGNIDPILGGQKDSSYVIKETLDLIKNVAPNGGYVMTTSNVITPDARIENFYAWLNTLKKYGRYPIKI